MGGNCYGKIFWNLDDRTAVLQVSNLPAIAPDRVYQLWVFPKEGEPMSAGLFSVTDPRRGSFYRLDSFSPLKKESVKGIVITLEARGGASKPTGEWYMGGRVGL